ncbi:putative fatty-acid--CoA ligase [Gordonia araii NBRC 100433]|uniref:Putative fatty-acid--CoA ligase n=1 Tax=Gordonia araii NBRC 100433 TaxID=1073574 RepID=G7H272_9ACTN|nr:long-chain-acyl-CoA synthetase [Gordonia araii]NNG97486.1 long-chain-acyl-CoA synthetase [Gordonia araii NBRC 100433]GAB09947.1 putative fatty-acid--CoA ligase [Gordonia araii NBRC 100433]
MSSTRSSEITLPSLLGGAWKLSRDLPRMAGQLPSLINLSPSRKWTIGKAFAKAAAAHPDRPFLRMGSSIHTYGECNRRANRWAAVLADNGVGRGDVVAVMARNSVEVVIAVLATVKLGAIAGMVNYNQTGEVLDHSLGLLAPPGETRRGARVLITDGTCDGNLATASAQAVPPTRLTFADLDATGNDLAVADPAVNANPAVTAALPADIPAFYIFTSGTTGYPKASIMSHSRWHFVMAGMGAAIRLRSDDVMYCALPLYHNNALTVSFGAVLGAGACLAIGEKFSASRFFDDIIANDATAFCYIGELCRYLLAVEPKPTDRAHRVRLAAGNGLRPDIWDEFQQRFGIERIMEFYGASESNIGFVNLFGQRKTVGFSPLPHAIVEVDVTTGEPLRDARGRCRRVKKGEPGLLLGRILPVARLDGYTDPAATEKKIVRDVFRRGDAYFNTGDLVYSQGYGHIGFADRLGDTFRWKGENVATTEVENVLNGVDGIAESVVYGVAVPGADGRAGMAAVVVGDDLDWEGLARAVRAKLPSYAVPLFVRVVPELEHTSTFKARRVELREEGYSRIGDDEVRVLDGDAGYVPFYPEFVSNLTAGRR